MPTLDQTSVHTARLFSLEESLDKAEPYERLDATGDTGPIDGDTQEALKLAYDIFYGTSPLTPCSSRSPSPTPLCPMDSAASVKCPARPPKKRRRAPAPNPLDQSRPRPRPQSKIQRDNKKSKQLRKLKRQAARLEDPESTRMPNDAASEKHVDRAEAEQSTFDSSKIPAGSTGYTELPDKKGCVHTLAELKEQGFKVVEWDGITPRPITDSDGRVIAVLAGRPADSSWDAVHQDAFRLLYDVSSLKKHKPHRRGNFLALNAGISFGGGQMAPGNLYHPTAQAGVLKNIAESTCFKRLAGFASGAFRTWMPGLYTYYEDSFSRLLDHEDHLLRNYDNSIWASAAYNFGPRAITAKHRDYANLPFGVCSVTALGNFDPTAGGHLVLWELGLVVEFPPGSTILIPSAAIAHSNTPIAAHERRASFTQYSAGGLFRWTDRGFQTNARFMKNLTEQEQAALAEGNKERRQLGLSLFSTLSDLQTK